jgi:hypothetical protein
MGGIWRAIRRLSSKLVSDITKRRRTPMKQTVAAYIAKTLEQAGVKRIWGVTGDSLNGLSDSRPLSLSAKY